MNATPFNHARHDQYSPAPSESNGNGNGKIFQLTPAADPLKLALLFARKRVAAFPRPRKGRPGLGNGAKNLFTILGDMSFDSRINERLGVVVVSDNYLARHMDVCERTIWDYRQQLIRVGEIWVSKFWRPNMWPCCMIHITAIEPKKPEEQPAGDGFYGAGKGRPSVPTPMGARKPGQTSLPLPGTKTPAPENTQVPDIAALSGNSLRLRAAESCGSEPQELAAQSRKNLRLRAAESCGSQPQEFAAQSRKNLRLSTAADCEQKRDSVKSVESDRGEGKKGTPPGLMVADSEAWIKLLDGAHLSRLQKIEADFLAELRKARSDSAKVEWRRRLGIVRERIHGPKVPDAPAPAPTAVLSPAPISRATPQEISSLIAQAKAAVEEAPTQQRTKGRQ